MPQIDPALARQIAATIADEIGAQTAQAQAAIALLDEGATVPFIARYRKEVTGGLDDTQLRNAGNAALTYLRELEDRRAAVLASIDEQGKLTRRAARRHRSRRQQGATGRPVPAVQAQAPHAGADRARGRAGAAGRWRCWPIRRRCRRLAAAAFVDADKGVADAKAALEGARAILMERWGEDAALVGELRAWLHEVGVIRARVAEGKQEARREVPRLLRPCRGAGEDSLAPPAGAVPRAPRGDPVPSTWIRAPMPKPGTLQAEGRVAVHAGIRDAGPAGRQVAARRLPPDLARQAAPAPAARSVRAGAREGRSRGDRRVRRQPQGSAAGRAGRARRRCSAWIRACAPA